MGSSISLDTGIQQYELYLLLGDVSSIFDEVVEGKVSIENGKHLVLNRLYRLNRVSLNEKPKDFVSSDHYKIFPNGKHLIEITEKYRDADGKHAWSVAIQYQTSSKIVKILHGIPGSKKESEAKNTGKRMTRSVSLDDLSSYSKTNQVPFQISQGHPGNQGRQFNQGHQGHQGTLSQSQGGYSIPQGRSQMSQGQMSQMSQMSQGRLQPQGQQMPVFQNQGSQFMQSHPGPSMHQKFASEPFQNQGPFRGSASIFNDVSDNIGFPSGGGGGGDDQDVLEFNLNGYG
jgi:hypothetical protein